MCDVQIHRGLPAPNSCDASACTMLVISHPPQEPTGITGGQDKSHGFTIFLIFLMSDILILYPIGYNIGVLKLKCSANYVTLYCHTLQRRRWRNSTLPLKASSSVVLWWVWGHQHSACRANTRIGSWQSPVGLNIANLKNKKGDALSYKRANPSRAKWDTLFIIFTSQ